MGNLDGLTEPAVKLFAKASSALSVINQVPPTQSFLLELVPLFSENTNSLLSSQFFPKLHELSLHRLSLSYVKVHLPADTFSNYEKYVTTAFERWNLDDIQKSTTAQSKNVTWFELKFARVSASILNAASCAGKKLLLGQLKVDEVHYAELKLFGAKKLKCTDAMLQGLKIEASVVKCLNLELHFDVCSAGLFLDKDRPFIAASPDGIMNDAVLEIKSPASDANIKKYIKADLKTPRKKLLLQILLQASLAKVKYGVLVVVKPKFKDSKSSKDLIISRFDCDQYDNEFNEHMSNAMYFYEKVIYPKLIKSVAHVMTKL
jgi:YqaJ-like viral recombinase domain